MIPNDGAFDIYVIQVWLPRRKEWVSANLDHFGRPHPAFYASGQCWQETKVSGTYRYEWAAQGLAVIRLRWPESRFRLVLIHLTRETEILED